MRKLSITHYLEWVLGNQRARTRAVHHHRDRPRDLRAPRAQSLEHRLSGACRFHGHGRAAAEPPAAIERSSSAATDRSPSPPHCLKPGSVVEPRGRRLRPVRCPADRAAPRAGRRDRDRPLARTGGIEKRGAAIDRALPRRGPRRIVQGGHGLLGSDARRHPGEDARPVDGRARERLAALSDARLPRVGAHRVLSVERRVGLPRSIARRDGPLCGAAEDRARAHLARRGAPVPRGRRAALVAAGHEHRASRRASPTIGSGCRTWSRIISR